MPPLHKMKRDKVTLSLEHKAKLLELLKDPFEKHLDRHNDMEWAKVQARLEANPDKLWSLSELERTGGELDVVGHDKKTGEYIFFDSSAETPKGRGRVCYNREGWESRNEHRPRTTSMDLATAMGIGLLTEEQYFELQKLGEFDRKTSRCEKTPADIRDLGGALYCDRPYSRVFGGQTGALSYYNSRGFRDGLKI